MSDDDIRCLSIQQPWAWLIVHGPKRIENRTWRTPFRGRFLIHAGLRVDAAALAHFRDALPERLDTGGVVGVARVAEIVTGSDDPWFFGPVGFVLEDVAPLPFIRSAGRLQFYRPGADLLAACCLA